MPTPAASRRHIACWAPVPDAATMPTDPGRTTFAKPSATPLTCAVPQSGPMTSTSAAAAASFRRTSSSTETLSENSITDRPESTASNASVTACCPGTETSARVAPLRRAAEPTVRGGTSSSPPPVSGRPRSAGERGLHRGEGSWEHVVGLGSQGHDEVVGACLVWDVEPHAAQDIDVELGRHGDLGRGHAVGAGHGP